MNPRLGSVFKKWLRGSKPRLTTRLTVEEPIDLFLSSGQWQPAILEDVSAGGACLRTYHRLHAGELIGVSLHLAFDQRYELSARVVYARHGAQGSQTRYGVRFVWADYEEFCKLDAFVTERENAGKLRGSF